MSATAPGEHEPQRRSPVAAAPGGSPEAVSISAASASVGSGVPSLAASLAGSAAGLAIALVFGGAASRLLPRSAQPPGLAALEGLDVRRELARWALAVVLPIAGGFVGCVLRARRAGRVAPAPEPAAEPAPRGETAGRSGAAAAIAAHAVIAWVFAAAAFPETARRAPAALLVLTAAASAALTLALGRGRLEAGAPFLGAAALMLPLALTSQRPIALAASAAGAVIGLPALVRSFVGPRSDAPRALRAATLAVLVPGSVVAAAGAAILGAPPIADLFEDGHELLPAAAYLRGESPYRDVVPGHGLLSDGGLDAASLYAFGDDYAGWTRGRKVLGAAFWPAVYAVGLGATGSPAAAYGTTILSVAAYCQYGFVRVIGSLAALALALAASRTGDRRLWAAAGAALAVAFLISVDFGVYAAAAAAAALWVSRGDRSAHLVAAAAGAAAAALPALAALAARGSLAAFVGTTFRLVPSLLPAYAQGFPPALTSRAGGAGTYAAAALACLLLGALLPLGKRIPEAARPLPPLCAWIALAMLAVLERRHLNYPFFAVPAAVVMAARWTRRSARDRLAGGLAACAIVGGFAVAHGAADLPAVIAGAIQPAPPRAGLAPLDAPRRARGAVFRDGDRALVTRTAELIDRAGFREGDTWLDFANEPALYFLFERPCPIRYYEVPFYESEAAQREVIEAVRANPRVRAVLMSGPFPPIDGVSNATRAPLVAAFIAESFRPFLDEGGIEFWIRKNDATEREATRP